MALEDEADGAVAELGDLRVVHREHERPSKSISPGGRRVQRAEHVQEGALARAGRADQRDELALLDVERDAAQHVDALAVQEVALEDVAELERAPCVITPP